MKLEKDFKELLKLFIRNNVKYCLVGSYAVGLYGAPRYTKDIDILIEPTPKNAQKIIKSLKQFGFGSLNLKIEDFTKEREIIQLGYEPVRIDLLTSLFKIPFSIIWKNKKRKKLNSIMLNVISFDDLVKAKKASRRPSDKYDLEKLKKLSKNL